MISNFFPAQKIKNQLETDEIDRQAVSQQIQMVSEQAGPIRKHSISDFIEDIEELAKDSLVPLSAHVNQQPMSSRQLNPIKPDNHTMAQVALMSVVNPRYGGRYVIEQYPVSNLNMARILNEQFEVQNTYGSVNVEEFLVVSTPYSYPNVATIYAKMVGQTSFAYLMQLQHSSQQFQYFEEWSVFNSSLEVTTQSKSVTNLTIGGQINSAVFNSLPSIFSMLYTDCGGAIQTPLIASPYCEGLIQVTPPSNGTSSKEYFTSGWHERLQVPVTTVTTGPTSLFTATRFCRFQFLPQTTSQIVVLNRVRSVINRSTGAVSTVTDALTAGVIISTLGVNQQIYKSQPNIYDFNDLIPGDTITTPSQASAFNPMPYFSILERDYGCDNEPVGIVNITNPPSGFSTSFHYVSNLMFEPQTQMIQFLGQLAKTPMIKPNDYTVMCNVYNNISTLGFSNCRVLSQEAKFLKEMQQIFQNPEHVHTLNAGLGTLFQTIAGFAYPILRELAMQTWSKVVGPSIIEGVSNSVGKQTYKAMLTTKRNSKTLDKTYQQIKTSEDDENTSNGSQKSQFQQPDETDQFRFEQERLAFIKEAVINARDQQMSIKKMFRGDVCINFAPDDKSRQDELDKVVLTVTEKHTPHTFAKTQSKIVQQLQDHVSRLLNSSGLLIPEALSGLQTLEDIINWAKVTLLQRVQIDQSTTSENLAWAYATLTYEHSLIWDQQVDDLCLNDKAHDVLMGNDEFEKQVTQLKDIVKLVKEGIVNDSQINLSQVCEMTGVTNGGKMTNQFADACGLLQIGCNFYYDKNRVRLSVMLNDQDGLQCLMRRVGKFFLGQLNMMYLFLFSKLNDYGMEKRHYLYSKKNDWIETPFRFEQQDSRLDERLRWLVKTSMIHDVLSGDQYSCKHMSFKQHMLLAQSYYKGCVPELIQPQQQSQERLEQIVKEQVEDDNLIDAPTTLQTDEQQNELIRETFEVITNAIKLNKTPTTSAESIEAPEKKVYKAMMKQVTGLRGPQEAAVDDKSDQEEDEDVEIIAQEDEWLLGTEPDFNKPYNGQFVVVDELSNSAKILDIKINKEKPDGITWINIGAFMIDARFKSVDFFSWVITKIELKATWYVYMHGVEQDVQIEEESYLVHVVAFLYGLRTKMVMSGGVNYRKNSFMPVRMDPAVVTLKCTASHSIIFYVSNQDEIDQKIKLWSFQSPTEETNGWVADDPNALSFYSLKIQQSQQTIIMKQGFINDISYGKTQRTRQTFAQYDKSNGPPSELIMKIQQQFDQLKQMAKAYYIPKFTLDDQNSLRQQVQQLKSLKPEAAWGVVNGIEAKYNMFVVGKHDEMDYWNQSAYPIAKSFTQRIRKWLAVLLAGTEQPLPSYGLGSRKQIPLTENLALVSVSPAIVKLDQIAKAVNDGAEAVFEAINQSLSPNMSIDKFQQYLQEGLKVNVGGMSFILVKSLGAQKQKQAIKAVIQSDVGQETELEEQQRVMKQAEVVARANKKSEKKSIQQTKKPGQGKTEKTRYQEDRFQDNYDELPENYQKGKGTEALAMDKI